MRAAPRLTLMVGRNGTGKTSALDAIWDNVTGVAGGAQGLHDGAAVYARDDRSISRSNGTHEAVEEPPRAERGARRRRAGKQPPTRWERIAEAVGRTWKETPATTRSSGTLLLVDEIEAAAARPC